MLMKTHRNLLLAQSTLAAVTTALAISSSPAQIILLADNFNTVGVGNSFNDNDGLVADQSGTLAPLSYSLNSRNWDGSPAWEGYFQRGNGEKMLLAGYDNPFAGNVFASVNRNFADTANSLNSPLEIKFELNVTDSQVPENWGTIAIGSAQNQFVNHPSNKFSSLFRDNGQTQQFASGPEVGASMTFSDEDQITLLLSDTAGTGSAFNGNGSVAKIFINDVLQFTSPQLGLGAGDGFITFQAFGTKVYYDNLVITATTATDPFVTWMADNYPEIPSPDNQPAADPDHDGIDNLIEYLLQGGDPSKSSTSILPRLDASEDNFVFTYFRRAAATGTSQTFEYASTLSGWTPITIPGGAGVVVTPDSPSAGIERVEITVAKGTETKLFGRLQVVR
jgi:hypothetical protein